MKEKLVTFSLAASSVFFNGDKIEEPSIVPILHEDKIERIVSKDFDYGLDEIGFDIGSYETDLRSLEERIMELGTGAAAIYAGLWLLSWANKYEKLDELRHPLKGLGVSLIIAGSALSVFSITPN